jgi:hypothetical protein
MSKTINYQVEVSINLCFYVDVDSLDENEAKKDAISQALEKAEEMVGGGTDRQGMIYGIGEPIVDSIENLEAHDYDEDEDDEGE